MPSVSPKQARLMAIAAHTPGGYDGVPQSVGEDFNAADEAKAAASRKPSAAKKARIMQKARTMIRPD